MMVRNRISKIISIRFYIFYNQNTENISSKQHLQYLGKCKNIDQGGEKDKNELDCSHYEIIPGKCEDSEITKDEDFDAKKNCCFCGGGTIPGKIKTSKGIKL